MMLVRDQLRTVLILRLVIIVLSVLLLITVLRIWKFEGRGAQEWYAEYEMCRYQVERISRCMQEFDQEIFYKRENGVVRYCKI